MTRPPIPPRPPAPAQASPSPYRAVPGGSRGAGEGPPRATLAPLATEAPGHGSQALRPSPRTRANGAQSANSTGGRR